MEHNSIKNLVEILKSQVNHYGLIRGTLQEEKTAVTNWDSNKVKELNKTKAQLIKKEKLLEEARKTISMRIQEEYNLADGMVLTIINGISESESKNELIQLRNELLSLVAEISQIMFTLKVLYNTNLKIISDIKLKMGFATTGKYGIDKSTVSMPSALQITG